MHLVAAVAHTLLSPCCFLAFAGIALGAAGDPAKSGPVVKGLCLRLEMPASKEPKKQPEHFSIVVENVSERDLNVRLGYSLNNGRSHHPDSLELIAKASGEAPHRLIYFDGRGGIAGRVDPFLVPLPAGASYTLRCPFNHFVDPQSLRPIDLKARDYRISASLTGKPVTRDDVNLDTLGQTMSPCWEGTIHSNEVRVSPSAPRGSGSTGLSHCL
jgi:hypothetical protein